MSSPSPRSRALLPPPPRAAHPTSVPGGPSSASARSAGPTGRVPQTALYSPMRLKLSDKVLRNFFILPIFSAGCGSMRSHIWATRGLGNFPKMVQSGAQTTARARGAGKAAPPPPPPPPPPPAAARQSAGLGRRRAGSAPAWAAAGRAEAVYVVPRAAAIAAAVVAPRSAAAAPLIFPPLYPRGARPAAGRGGWRGRRRAEGGPGTRCGSRGLPSARGADGDKFSAPSSLSSGEKAVARNHQPPCPPRPSRRRRRRRPRPAFPSAKAPRRWTPARPQRPARSPRLQPPSPPPSRPRSAAPAFRP